MKKVILTVSVLALLLAVWTMSVSAATGTASVTAPGEVFPGQEISFTVTISEADPVLAAMIVPVYDEAVFELVDGRFLRNGVLTDFSDGNGVIAWEEPTDINGDLLVFTLRAKENAVIGGSCTIGCTYTVSNQRDEREPGDVNGMTVTVLCDHSYEAVATAPTCTEGGYTTYTCACGHSYMADETAALGHDWAGAHCTRCDAVLENPFNDVPEDSFYCDPVLWAVENGITNGSTFDMFNPLGNCQRAQVVTFLWRAAGKPEPTVVNNPFVDVRQSDFYYKAVLWAVEKGITNGVDATHFDPFAYCNRAQVVTFLFRAMGSPGITSGKCPFTDVGEDAWYENPILWAVENGITNGMGGGLFGVDITCNRAQVVTFLYRTYVN